MDGEIGYTLNEYQKDVRKAQDTSLKLYYVREHAKAGLVSEVGEIIGLYQRQIQGYAFDEGALKIQMGNVLGHLSELCDCYGWTMEDVARANIAKLKVRYPERYTVEQSNRKYRENHVKLRTKYYAKGEGRKNG